jgi:RNA polymerase sigma factor (sigma-70 family)
MRNKDNLGIIKSVTNKYIKSIRKDELYRCGLHGLWRVLQYHRDGMGQKFTTSLYKFVDWECKKRLKERKREKRQIPIDTLAIDIADKTKDESISHLLECMTMLPKPYYDILDMYYFQDMTLEEIGNRLGFTKEAARQNINKAEEKLHRIYTKH